MAASNITDTTPWKKFFCNKDTVCSEPGFECHANTYCIPQLNLQGGESCLDAKDTVAPFVARIDNIYHLYCDMPTDLKPQNVTCPLGCEKWENCHGNVCMIKKCTKDQLLCKQGQVDMCMGLRRDEILCYDPNPHGKAVTTGTPVPNNVTDNSSSEDKSNVGAIAGGVSAAVVVVLAIGAFFMVRRRRAAKAAKAAAAAQTLPTYSSQDEKNAMSQVA